MLKRYQLRIYGKVQGVYYRASTKQKAEELEVVGFVKNESDGSVYAEIEGAQSSLDVMVEWCKQGPILAHVTEIIATPMAPKGDTDFLIIRR